MGVFVRVFVCVQRDCAATPQSNQKPKEEKSSEVLLYYLQLRTQRAGC